MAPKRRGRPRKADKPVEDDAEKQETPASAEQDEAVEEDKAETEPSPKKPKVEEKKKRGRKPKATSKKTVPAAATNKSVDEDSGEDEEAEEGFAEEAPAKDKSEKVIVIEASKECNCFKTRAAKVQTGLTKAIPGIEVLINPDKPRKGCFEVRGKDGDIYMSLLGLPRPFTKLKKLDMDKEIEEIIAKVK